MKIYDQVDDNFILKIYDQVDDDFILKIYDQVAADFTYENDVSWTSGAGHGYAGFYLSYWQASC